MECRKKVERLMNNNNNEASSSTTTADKVKDFQDEMEQDDQILEHELTLFGF